MPSEFLTEPLDKRHARTAFTCGESELDSYLQKYARLDQERKETAVFILPGPNNQIRGYYTLSALHIHIEEFPPEALKKLKLSSYKHKPATLLGRLAVDQKFKGQKLGKHLLIDALKRSFYQSSKVGSVAVVVDALHDQAAQFYIKFGFIPFSSQPLRLFLPMKTIGNLFP